MNRKDQAGVVMAFLVWILISESKGCVCNYQAFFRRNEVLTNILPPSFPPHSLFGCDGHALGASQSLAGDSRHAVLYHMRPCTGVARQNCLYRSRGHSSNGSATPDHTFQKDACHVFALSNIQATFGSSLSDL
jgi:hypothetical protein